MTRFSTVGRSFRLGTASFRSENGLDDPNSWHVIEKIHGANFFPSRILLFKPPAIFRFSSRKLLVTRSTCPGSRCQWAMKPMVLEKHSRQLERHSCAYVSILCKYIMLCFIYIYIDMSLYNMYTYTYMHIQLFYASGYIYINNSYGCVCLFVQFCVHTNTRIYIYTYI